MHWKWYGGTLIVKEDKNLDLDIILMNKNSEWKKHEFIFDEDFTDIEIFIEPENDSYEDIVIEQDLGLLEEKLSDDGYKLLSDKMIYEEGKIQIV